MRPLFVCAPCGTCRYGRALTGRPPGKNACGKLTILRVDLSKETMGDKVELDRWVKSAVEAVRKDEDWRNEYMTEYIYLQDIREEEDMKISKKVVDNMTQRGLTPEEITRLTGIPQDSVLEILGETSENEINDLFLAGNRY